MKTLQLSDAVKELYDKTKVVRLPYEEPSQLRSRIGDVLHRAGQAPAWWRESGTGSNGQRVPSPFRVAPDIDTRFVRVQWLEPADDIMMPLVQLMFRGTQVEKLSPSLAAQGNIVTVQYLSPQYYTVGASKWNKYHNHDVRGVPNLGLLTHYTRVRNRVLLSHWLDIDIDKGENQWFSANTFTLLDSDGGIITLKHRAHKTGFEFKATGFVGQALYIGEDEKALNEAHCWLQLATLWGAASGTTWGWSSLWETRFEADLNLREPEVMVN